MDGEIAKGAVVFPEGQASEPTTGGAVAGQPTGEVTGIPTGEQAPPKAEDIAAKILADYPEADRATLTPLAMKLAKEALDNAQRVTQSRFTRRQQEVADKDRALEIDRARIEEQKRFYEQQQVQTQTRGPQQDPITFLDGQVQAAIEAGDADALVMWRTRRETFPVIMQQQQQISVLAKQLGEFSKKQEETTLRSDPLYGKYAAQVDAEHARCNGAFSREQIFKMLAADDYKREAQALRGGDADKARVAMQQKAANAVAPPGVAPSAGGLTPGPRPAPKTLAEAVEQGLDEFYDQQGKITASESTPGAYNVPTSQLGSLLS